MPASPPPPGPDRRRFLKTVGVAGLAAAIAPSALAQSAGPRPAGSPAPADSAAAPAPPAPPEISDDARSLAEIVRRRYGAHLTPEQLEAVTRELNNRVQGGRRLRESRLANGDEPDVTFRA